MPNAKSQIADRSPRALDVRRFAIGFSNGFTMVEVVIMLVIIVIISTIVLANFPSVSGSINVQRTSQRFALVLRQMQNQAFAVRLVQGQSGPIVPPALGIYISTAAPLTYLTFADMNLNKKYDAGSDIVVETINLEKAVKVFEIRDGVGQTQTDANIVFTVPEAQATIFNASESIGESALIKFKTDTGGFIKSVRVRTSGQIAIE